MSTNSTFHSLFISDLRLFVKLGCEEVERRTPQEVRLSIEFRFSSVPKATQTDEIGDTVCYAKVSQAIKNYCEGKEFKLIEKLALDLVFVTKDVIGNDMAMALTVHKIKPPIENLIGGTQYRIADFL